MTLAAETTPQPATPILQTEVPISKLGLHATAKAAERMTGRPASEMLSEMAGLCYGRVRLRPEEYFELGIFDPSLSPDDRRRYAGARRSAKINASVNRILGQTSRTLDNKILLNALVRGLGLLAVETRAMIGGDKNAPLISLRSREAVASFLRDAASYPLFGKPLDASLSLGAASLDAYDAERDVIRHHSGAETSVTSFIDEVFKAYARTGYVFQPRLSPHPELERIAGPALGTTRVVTAHHGDRIDLLYAVWKAPKLGATADNFWRDGNMLVDIDVDSGLMRRCQRGAGLKAEEIQRHPGTGESIVGETMPCWSELRSAACSAAWAFPEFPIIGWDIAITRDGPTVIEANSRPHHMLHQIAAQKGLMTPAFETYLETTIVRMNRLKKRRSSRWTGLFARARKQYIRNLIWGGAG